MKYLLREAILFAEEAHKGQQRKYTGEPYINHPMEVSEILMNHYFPVNVVIGGLLHDIVEDTQVTLEEIRKIFGNEIAGYVEDLTDVYTPEAYPGIRRKERKLLEAYRLSNIHKNSKAIKLADIISNTPSIVYYDKDFANIYIPEKWNVFKSCDISSSIKDRAREVLQEAKELLLK